MLKNAPTLAVVAVHTEENKPPKVCKQKNSIPGVDANQRKLNHFGGLVLGCIDASDSESRRIFQHFSRFLKIYKIDLHTFAPLRYKKFSKKLVQNFAKMMV